MPDEKKKSKGSHSSDQDGVDPILISKTSWNRENPEKSIKSDDTHNFSLPEKEPPKESDKPK